MVAMAEPWRHPETGTYYLRRQIPKPLRNEFGGKQLWKRSLETKDAGEARAAFTVLNAELERMFAAARDTIAERSARYVLTPESAAKAVARIAAIKTGSKYDSYPVLGNIFLSEEAASTMLGGIQISIVNAFIDRQPAEDIETTVLPGDVWLQFVRTRSRDDALRMAEHMIHWVHGGFREEGGYGDIIRNPENDWHIMNAVTDAVAREQAALRLMLGNPVRSVPTRLRSDMKLGELLDAWKSKTPAPGAQGAHETATTVADFIDYFGDVAVSRITGDHLYNFRDAVACLPKAMPRVDRSLGFNARLAKFQAHDAIKVAPASIKRRVGHIQALLTYAFSQRWIEHNTGSGIPIEGYAKNTGGRRPFLDDELALLFASPLFLKAEKWSFARDTVSDMTLAWFFLLGLTNGARIEEIGQTELTNVKTDGGVHYFDLGQDAKVKNDGSRRMIPLHKTIIDLGFDDYVVALRKAGHTRLFPELRANKFEKMCQAASQVANRVIDRTVSSDPRLAFHSLRHNFKDLARDVPIEKYIMDQIMGHAGVTTGDGYGIGARFKTLSRELNRITFDMISWTAIRAGFALIDWDHVVGKVR
jgi:integrase